MKKLLLIIVLVVCTQAYADYNYAEALQKAIFFFEGQQSGWLSENNRVEWRAPSHTDDGQDVGLDLSGGWYDAGDHWKTNTTMSSTILKLSWSVLLYPEAFEKTGQMDELLENLKYGTDYFLKCIVDGNPGDPENFDDFDLYFDVGNTLGPKPSVHSVWCAPEVTNGYTVREALRVNAGAPGPDVAAKMSAAMAAAAMVFSGQGEPDYADDLYSKAVKLFNFADWYTFDDNTLREDGVYALAPNDEFRRVGYRNDDPRQDLLMACGFLQQAYNAFFPESENLYYLEYARDLYDEILLEYEIWEYFPWWKTHDRISPIMSLLYVAEEDQYKNAWKKIVYDHVKAWEELPPIPGGYRIRDVWGGAFTLLKGTNESFLALIYSDYTSNAARKQTYFDFAKSQMDYVLGDNLYNKSFMVGFGENGYFNALHHTGAQGPWAGFAHIDPNNSLCLWENRHILYGALPGGPDLNGEYDPVPGDWMHNEVTIHSGASVVGLLAGLVAQNPDAYSPIPDDQFPPPEERNLSLDPQNTDREFFVTTRLRDQSETSIRVLAQLNNRSNWPARVADSLSFRVYLTLDDGATPEDLTITLQSPRDGKMSPLTLAQDNVYYVEMTRPGLEMWPNVDGDGSHYSQTFIFQIKASDASKWDVSNDWSLADITSENAIILNMPVYEKGTLIAGNTPFTSEVSDESNSQIPESITLRQNYPNPFNPSTFIRFENTHPEHLKLEIFNARGQHVRTLTDDFLNAGSHQLAWNGLDKNGRQVPSGLYYARLTTSAVNKSIKLLLLR